MAKIKIEYDTELKGEQIYNNKKYELDTSTAVCIDNLLNNLLTNTVYKQTVEVTNPKCEMIKVGDEVFYNGTEGHNEEYIVSNIIQENNKSDHTFYDLINTNGETLILVRKEDIYKTGKKYKITFTETETLGGVFHDNYNLDTTKPYITFGCLTNGDKFKYENEYYVRIESILEDDNVWNAINLRNGKKTNFGGDVPVENVNELMPKPVSILIKSNEQEEK